MRLREEMIRVARIMYPEVDDESIGKAVSLLVDDESADMGDTVRAISQTLRVWAYDPTNPDILADLLLVHRRSTGLDQDP